MKVKLSVTRDDIDNGGDGADTCPIALAMKRAVPNWEEVEVDGNIILRTREYMDGYPYTQEYLLYKTEEVNIISDFVEKYDSARYDETFPFEVELNFEEVVREPPDPEY